MSEVVGHIPAVTTTVSADLKAGGTSYQLFYNTTTDQFEARLQDGTRKVFKVNTGAAGVVAVKLVDP